MYNFEVWEFDADAEEYTRKVWETDYYTEACDYAYDFSRRNDYKYIVLDYGEPVKRMYNGREL